MQNIAEELVRIFSRVGFPKELLMDKGTNFTSKLLSKVYEHSHVKALRSTPYHPQTDELVNQTLKKLFRKTACEEGKDWDKLLPYVLFAYCINHNLSKAVWQAGCKAALIAKDKSCSLSGYLSSQACR